MSERLQSIKTALEQSARRVDYVLDRVGDRWHKQVYSEGAAWDVRQLALHLSISYKGQYNQVVGIAEGREVIPADFDLERFNRRSVEKGADKTVEQIRSDLAASRHELLTWLAGLEDESVLANKGRHASMQILSVEEILRHIASHDTTHADDIARVLSID